MIYFLKHPETGLVKIGTTVDYKLRLSQLITKYGDLELLGLMFGSYDFEKELHQQFSHLQAFGVLDGREWFNPEKELIDYINRYSSFNTPLPASEKELSGAVQYTARIPCTPEVHQALRDITHAAGITFDDLFRFWLQEKGVNIEDRESTLKQGLEWRDMLREFSVETD